MQIRLAAIDARLDEWRAELAGDLRRRAMAAHARGDDPSWWTQRAGALERGWSQRAAGCEAERQLTLTCHECGEVRERWLPCGQRHWCSTCADRRRKREYARLVPALGTRTAEERRRWFRAGGNRKGAPQLRLLTLTVRTQGNLRATKRAIEKAWPRFRRWLWDAVGYAPPFAATWEITDAEAGPHPHLHVCVVLPWVSVTAMAEAWTRATSAAAEAQGLDLRTCKTKTAARYVAAYVTASVLDPSLSVETAAEWIRATYARRLVHSSRGFWLMEADRPRCDCGACAPVSVRISRPEITNTDGARAPPAGGQDEVLH